jgi:hypothetical protein
MIGGSGTGALRWRGTTSARDEKCSESLKMQALQRRVVVAIVDRHVVQVEVVHQCGGHVRRDVIGSGGGGRHRWSPRAFRAGALRPD